ncbi:MAG: hypothetical protein K0S33_144 [Bacteroidetes bacterium]|jgi:hypothetical protein|nr:hypothetical protein [Bacteroidota bacterium]
MKNVILLDLDGVLIITPPWKPDEIHADGYSDFNRIAVKNLNSLLNRTAVEIWLSSSRRMGKSVAEFNTIFRNRGIEQEIKGFIPSGTLSQNRLVEVDAFLNHEPIRNFLIIDDDNSLQDLTPTRKNNWIKTDSLLGFTDEKLLAAIEIVKNWKS